MANRHRGAVGAPAPGLLPVDLSRCIGRKTLVRLTLEELDRLRDLRPDGAFGPASGPFSPAFLFTLLTYCYATGALASVDIELARRTDPMVRYLCGGAVPDIDTIRLFRRRHGEDLGQLLAAVLRRVWALRFDEEDAGSGVGTDYFRDSLGRWGMARPDVDFDHEARDRLGRAIRADSMALDS